MCSGYDSQHTPAASELVVAAWLDHFQIFPNVTREDLLTAVREYHCTEHDKQLTPVALSSIARKYARDRYERSALDSDQRLAHEALCEAKGAEEIAAIESAAPARQ